MRHKVEVYDEYNPPPKPEVSFDGCEVLTQQSFKDECDINVLLQRYKVTGVVGAELLSSRSDAFIDVLDVGDFMDCQNRLIDARNAFDSLPSSVRERFDNDAMKLVEFLSDVKNRGEAVELGLIDDKRKPLSRVERSRKVDVRERELEEARAAGRREVGPSGGPGGGTRGT